jgi:hypothetical protein
LVALGGNRPTIPIRFAVGTAADRLFIIVTGRCRLTESGIEIARQAPWSANSL